MKKLLFMITLVIAFSGILYSSYQTANVYVCEEEVSAAELLAKAVVSRKDLTRVSYCVCNGVDPSLKELVKPIKNFKSEIADVNFEVSQNTCEPPKDSVYACMCVGQVGN
ncbi:MAG: hypothetical protein GY754_31030 [bacterium]|nr:hypothetical protein [bacterium]